jgi:trigger factor
MADPAHTHEGFDVAVERRDDGTAQVSFTVTAAEFERTVARGLANAGSRTRMKGFRQGKVPPQILEKQFGAEVRREAAQHFLNHAYDRAMKQHELRPAAHPRVSLEDLAVEKGQPFSMNFRVFLRPKVELGQYKALSIERQAISVSDEEVELALADLRRQRSRPEPAGPEGLPADGMALCGISFYVEGSDEVQLERDNIRLSPKTAPGGIDPAVFEQRLSGAKEGDTIDVPLTFPPEFPRAEVHGKQGTCRVSVRQAFRIVPPSDEEIYRLMDVADDAAMRSTAKERIGQAKEREEDARLEAALFERVIESHALEIPAEYLKEQVEAKAEETRQNLVAQGVAEEAAAAQVAEQREAFQNSTEKGLRAVYLMEEIARVENLKVTEEELKNELGAIAQRNNASFEEVRKYYQEQRMFPQLALELLERKVRRFLRESADIHQPSA